MIIEEVGKEEYNKVVFPKYVFDKVDFNELNSYKVRKVNYYLFKDNKIRFGLCMGQQGEVASCPFSAPFGALEYVTGHWDLKQLEEAVDMLDNYAAKYWKKVKFILPPVFYDEVFIPGFTNTLIRKDYKINYLDLNYQFNLNKVYTDEYVSLLPRNGRKNLAVSLRSNLSIEHCNTIERKKRAYEIISINRKSKGYPLRMSFEQVEQTIKIVKHDFFIVWKDKEEIAAAQIFYVCDKIVQVIYWGDIPGYSQLKPINYLAYQLIRFYGERGFKYLDIGPSTDKGVPNFGLCDFKNSIGCDISLKFALEKSIV